MGYSFEEAKKILTATLAEPSHLISVEMRAARRWLPWLRERTRREMCPIALGGSEAPDEKGQAKSCDAFLSEARGYCFRRSLYRDHRGW
jgi:hypothetical protein